ncbi:hypothetical protein DSECCO2_605810 [anaerobic digester metagenome]
MVQCLPHLIELQIGVGNVYFRNHNAVPVTHLCFQFKRHGIIFKRFIVITGIVIHQSNISVGYSKKTIVIGFLTDFDGFIQQVLSFFLFIGFVIYNGKVDINSGEPGFVVCGTVNFYGFLIIMKGLLVVSHIIIYVPEIIVGLSHAIQ